MHPGLQRGGRRTDRLGRPVDSASVWNLGLLELEAPEVDVIADLTSSALTASDLASQWLLERAAGATSACASELDEDPEQTWLLELFDRSFGGLTGVVVVPREDSTNHVVTITDTSTVVTVTGVELANKPPLETTEGEPRLVADWSQVTTDANGAPFDSLMGDRLLVARFDRVDVAGVEARILELESSATESWTLEVFGRTDADLAGARTADGRRFAGFTTDGLWVLAVTCSTCWIPAPLLLATVDVAPR